MDWLVVQPHASKREYQSTLVCIYMHTVVYICVLVCVYLFVYTYAVTKWTRSGVSII